VITKEVVYDQLKKVLDPELNINIVDLGLIYDVKVEGRDVVIVSTLTFPGCPLGSVIHREIKEKVGKIKGVGKIDLKVTFEPPWDLSKVSDEARSTLGII
jgi:metal-sulfur cluster biosynthetic enzyme